MKYNPKSPLDKRQAEVYFNRLINGTEVFELKVYKRRNNDQNALLHAWIRVLQDHLGYTSFEDCKRDVVREILGQRNYRNPLNGLIEQTDYRTSEMEQSVMSDLMTKLKAWAQEELGCYLPYFKDAGFEELMNNYL